MLASPRWMVLPITCLRFAVTVHSWAPLVGWKAFNRWFHVQSRHNTANLMQSWSSSSTCMPQSITIPSQTDEDVNAQTWHFVAWQSACHHCTKFNTDSAVFGACWFPQAGLWLAAALTRLGGLQEIRWEISHWLWDHVEPSAEQLESVAG